MSGAGIQRVRVAAPSGSYEVRVGAGVMGNLGQALATSIGEAAAGRRAFVIFDRQLPEALLDGAVCSLRDAGFDASTWPMRAAETEKSIDTAHRALLALAENRHERTEPVVALGGGLVGDVAGFVAAVYRRGVPLIQCPTTLLAMVDASVGGKTGVNLCAGDRLLKNMVGAFWQPRLVIADVSTLDSLPERQFRAGLAECVKHGLLAGESDSDLFEWITQRLDKIAARDEQTLVELIARNVAVKESVVSADEREKTTSLDNPGRAALNLGHTFAHAIETLPDVSPNDDPSKAPLLHGEAVGLGLVAAAASSVELGLLDRGTADRIRDAVASAGLPRRVTNLPDETTIIETIRHDKKTSEGRLRFVLPCAIGSVRLVEDPPEKAIRAGLAAIRW